MTKSEIGEVFSNIETIYQSNFKIVSAMEKAKNAQGFLNPNIGVIFSQHVCHDFFIFI
jgi:hypothetical protein